MKPEEQQQAKEAGKEVWKSIELQLAEGSGFFGGMLHSIRNFILQQTVGIVIWAIIVGALGTGLWFVKPKSYKANMTVSYVLYEKKIYGDMLTKLNDLIKTESYNTLGRMLNVNPDELESLKAINTYNIENEPLVEDLSIEKIPFYVEVEVENTALLPALEKGLVQYMNNTPYITERLELQAEQNKAELEFYEERLVIIDSLLKHSSGPEGGAKKETSNAQLDLITESKEIYKRIIELRGTSVYNRNIEVLDGFVAGDKPSGKSWKVWLAIGAALGAAFRLVYVFLKG